METLTKQMMKSHFSAAHPRFLLPIHPLFIGVDGETGKATRIFAHAPRAREIF